ncbi:VOC family protein [Nocardioides aestuarii]|uniref:VOC family protein n=1 Tax=Nocardioides aestuarii TaxID=252231 RepID=A0ABW4TSR9_9ACTN
MTDPIARLAMVTLDCRDAEASARFWSEVLGWELVAAGDGYAMLSGPDHALGFGSLPDHEPPSWPDEHGRKQFHFDLAVDDLAEAEERCAALGASAVAPQPGETWRVMVDPGGHPFCLTKAENWG